VTSSSPSSIASLPLQTRLAIRQNPERFTKLLSPEEIERWLWDWKLWARPEQLPPPGDDWTTWLILAGRGFGKTRTGAETVREWAASGYYRRIGLIAPTAADVRDVMVEGESGILACCPNNNRPLYEPSKRRLTWPNGALATTYSADEPERLRGPQHEALWGDEVCSWERPEAWDMAMFGLRLGPKPRSVVTTTPKPTRLLRELLKSPTTVITRGSTYDNRANLSPVFFEKVVKKYEGTRLGRQELMAEVLDQAEGALWNRDMLESTRVTTHPEFKRVVVGLDPAATKSATSDEVGVIVGALGFDDHGYILVDDTQKLSPEATCRKAVNLLDGFGADRIVAEVNNGGDWIETALRNVRRNVSYKKLHASRGKHARAEPVAALWEQKRCHLVGSFPDLEDELCSWEPAGNLASPNRLDAMVWVITELMLSGSGVTVKRISA